MSLDLTTSALIRGFAIEAINRFVDAKGPAKLSLLNQGDLSGSAIQDAMDEDGLFMSMFGLMQPGFAKFSLFGGTEGVLMPGLYEGLWDLQGRTPGGAIIAANSGLILRKDDGSGRRLEFNIRYQARSALAQNAPSMALAIKPEAIRPNPEDIEFLEVLALNSEMDIFRPDPEFLRQEKLTPGDLAEAFQKMMVVRMHVTIEEQAPRVVH